MVLKGELRMKRILVLLFSLTLLISVGCSSDEATEPIEEVSSETLTAHIDIRDEIVQDSYQVMRIVERSVRAGDDSQLDVLLDYEYKYKEFETISLEEEEVIVVTHIMINAMDGFKEGEQDFKAYKKAWYETIETGVIPSID